MAEIQSFDIRLDVCKWKTSGKTVIKSDSIGSNWH